jgi:MFS family permease
METIAARRQPGFMTGLSLILPITMSVMAALFVAPIAPKMAEYFVAKDPASAASIGWYIEWIITVPSLCVALFSPFAGALGDRFGRRRLLLLSMSVYSGVGILPAFLDDLNLILASRVALGIVEAMLMTLSTTLIGDFFRDERRDRWLAAQTGIASITAIIVLIVAGAVGQRDWHAVFLLYLIPALWLVLLLFFTWEPEESEHLGEAGVHAAWSELPWRLLAGICAITLFGSMMFYAVQIKLPVALNDLGVTLADGSYDAAAGSRYAALASIFVPVGTVCYWWLSPRTTLRARFLIEFTLMGAGFLLMLVLKDPLQFALAAGVNQIGAGMLLPTLLTWAVSQLPFEMRARGTGIWTSTFALGQFACNVVAIPIIMGFTGGMIPTFGALGWACLAAAVIVVVTGARPAAIAGCRWWWGQCRDASTGDPKRRRSLQGTSRR